MKCEGGGGDERSRCRELRNSQRRGTLCNVFALSPGGASRTEEHRGGSVGESKSSNRLLAISLSSSPRSISTAQSIELLSYETNVVIGQEAFIASVTFWYLLALDVDSRSYVMISEGAARFNGARTGPRARVERRGRVERRMS